MDGIDTKKLAIASLGVGIIGIGLGTMKEKPKLLVVLGSLSSFAGLMMALMSKGQTSSAATMMGIGNIVNNFRR